jgi:hypothetical protein
MHIYLAFTWDALNHLLTYISSWQKEVGLVDHHAVGFVCVTPFGMNIMSLRDELASYLFNRLFFLKEKSRLSMCVCPLFQHLN